MPGRVAYELAQLERDRERRGRLPRPRHRASSARRRPRPGCPCRTRCSSGAKRSTTGQAAPRRRARRSGSTTRRSCSSSTSTAVATARAGAAFPGISFGILLGRGHRLRVERDVGRLRPRRPVRRDALRRQRHDVPLPRRVPSDDDVRRRARSSVGRASPTSRSCTGDGPRAGPAATRPSTAGGSRSRASARRAVASSARSASSSTLSMNRVRSASDFVRAASTMELTFNWVYADSRSIAQFTSGRLPVRPATVDPGLPTKGTGEYEWQGFLPAARARADDQPGERRDPQLEQQARAGLRGRRRRVDVGPGAARRPALGAASSGGRSTRSRASSAR